VDEALPEVVRDKLEALPPSPGVYVFRDRRGAVVYVGKATSLRARVRSYFAAGSSDGRYFVAGLAHEIGDLETFVTRSEKEAMLLENNLIKEHRPRYNVKLRDDKEYLSLRLDPKARWPRLEVVRRPRQDDARYFGPYHSATAARQTLRLVNRHFQLRTCTDAEMRARVRPCLQYQIRRCPGPCVMEVDAEAYAQQVRAVALFLDGRHDELLGELRARMTQAATALEYERAGVFRDQIRAVERVREEQRVTTARDVDQDALGIYREGEAIELALLEVRGGRLVSVRTYDLDARPLPDAEIVASFVAEYYGRGGAPPDELLLPVEVDAMEGLAEVLSEGRRARVKVSAPRRGPKADLVRMAMENAAHAFREKRRAQRDVEERLGQVQKRLRLPRLPRRIECIDVSHTGGTDTVAAIVAMRDGELDRKRYKSFHVRRVSGGDDYGAMYEVLTRRLRRAQAGTAGWELPDLLVVDGGKGQLGVALAALADAGVRDLPVAGLAKEKENAAGERLVDRVYLPGQKNAIALREGTTTLHYLALLRDEAHRASNALRVRLGKRRRLRSGLADVPGVGAQTARALLRALGSLRAVQAATEEALVAAGATRAQARAIRAHFAAGAEAPARADSTGRLDSTGRPGSTGRLDPSGRLDSAERLDSPESAEAARGFMRDEGSGLDAADAAVEAAFAEAEAGDADAEEDAERTDAEAEDCGLDAETHGGDADAEDA
jgi:excinuclease ABC subunit C